MLRNNEQANYLAAGALSDLRIMEALLGHLPASHKMDIPGFTMGKVLGADVNGRMRTDVLNPEYQTRVLIPQEHSSVSGRLYTGLTRKEFELIRAFTYEGVVTREGTSEIGNGHESVGEAVIHVVKEGLPFEVLSPELHEEFLNGFEATITAAEATHNRLEEPFHGPSPERR